MTRAFGTRVKARRTWMARSRTVNTRAALLGSLALGSLLGTFAASERAAAQPKPAPIQQPAPPTPPAPGASGDQPAPGAKPRAVRTRRPTTLRNGRTTFIAPPADGSAAVPPAPGAPVGATPRPATPPSASANGAGDDFTVGPGA